MTTNLTFPLPITLDRQYKTCKYCKTSQPIHQFDIHKTCIDGRDHRCRSCKNEKMRANYHYKKQLRLRKEKQQ